MKNADKQTGQTEYHYLIDCFRILAVLMVLTVHVRGYLSNIPSSINWIFSIGAYGVALYFIVSGFLSYPSVNKSSNFKNYMKKKLVRILPMYYISLLLTFIVGGMILKEYPITWQWIYHVFFLNMFVPAKEWMWWNSVNFYWTMPAFIAWYMVSYLLFQKIDNSKKMFVVVLITSAAVPFLKKGMMVFMSEQFVNWNFFCLLYVFCFGALSYFIIKEREFLRGVLYGAITGIAGLVVGNKSGFFVFGIMFYFLIIITSLFSLQWKNEKVMGGAKYCPQ